MQCCATVDLYYKMLNMMHNYRVVRVLVLEVQENQAPRYMYKC